MFQALFSNQPVLLKEKEGKKLVTRWYYIDIEKALNPDVEREDAIIALPSSRKKTGFGINETLDCSTEEKEYELMMFPVNKVFQYSAWRSGYSKVSLSGGCPVPYHLAEIPNYPGRRVHTNRRLFVLSNR